MTALADPHDLARFLKAQQPVVGAVITELAAGCKRSHWMWFVFPQLKGLGRSATAALYGLAGRDEALAYWRHPVLGARLQQCCALVLAVPGKTAHEIFGTPDEAKFRSCATLFEAVAPEEPVFRQVLDRFYGGRRDDGTLALLQA